MSNFKILLFDQVVFSTTTFIRFKNELINNYNKYMFTENYTFVFPDGKNTSGIDNSYCLDDWILDDMLEDLDLDSLSFITFETIQDISDLSIVDDSYFDDQFYAENLQMIPKNDLNHCFNGFLGIGNKSHLKHWEL